MVNNSKFTSRIGTGSTHDASADSMQTGFSPGV